ncbi:MAG: EAL domain-containing protein [Acidimicrobiales bacterium]
MVVADDRAIGDSLSAVLSGEGFEVLGATNSSEAMSVSDTYHPSAVIVDHQLAQGTGVDLARQLKRHDPTAGVLLLTSPGQLDAIMPAGSELDGLLVKPLLPQVFVMSVRNALSIRALAEQNLRLASQVARLSEGEGIEHAVPEPPNRSFFADRLGSALTQSQADRDPMAVVVVELGGWEAFLEEVGEARAEEAVGALAANLAGHRRRTDLVGRIATDRFAIACSNIRSQSDCHRVVRIVLDALEGPVVHEGKEHWLTARAGAVLTDPSSPGQTAEMLLGDAEMALKCAHDEGRPWRLFEKSMLDEVFAREGVALAIREAMDNEDLALVYHPVTDLQTGRVVGAALRLRWMKDEPVLVTSEYLAQEGDVALSAQVGAWMLDRAFADLAKWREAHQLEDGFYLAVSISARDATDPQFAETVEELMNKHAVSGVMLNFDLSASAAREAASASFALAHLGELGIRFNFDDFGNEEINLSWLTELPVKALKIDAPLIEALDAQEDLRATTLVRSLIALAHELRLTVVSKGVRTSAQRMALLAMGCELAQYSRFGRPGEPGQPWDPDDEPGSSSEPPAATTATAENGSKKDPTGDGPARAQP